MSNATFKTFGSRINAYEKLVRLDKPIGILLLLWPTLWAIWIASRRHPNAWVVWIFILGTVLMRSAGCAVNDWADRNYDRQVKRTRERPLAAGTIAPWEALVVAAVLALGAFALVLQFNNFTILLSVIGVALSILYPFTKRFFSLPQAWLGLAFSFGIPMAFAAQLDTLPPIMWVLVAEERRDEVIKRIRDSCDDGAQAYWVCPLIEESETLQLKTAIETFEMIKGTFPELSVGLVHGRLKPDEKAQVMADFKAKKIQLLVATTVIEVGVDVPNATLMVIEHAERMGLAQLHQLRGRVGRGTQESHAILLYYQPLSEAARTRLKVIYENNDGFEIARQDLLLRGPGEYLGARQSGAPLLRFADLEKDLDLIELARETAEDLIDAKSHSVMKHVDRWLGTRKFYLKA